MGYRASEGSPRASEASVSVGTLIWMYLMGEMDRVIMGKVRGRDNYVKRMERVPRRTGIIITPCGGSLRQARGMLEIARRNPIQPPPSLN